MGAANAIHASRLSRNESGAHKVSLDQVIRTMYLTGLDMQSRYKETSLAGLALERDRVLSDTPAKSAARHDLFSDPVHSKIVRA